MSTSAERQRRRRARLQQQGFVDVSVTIPRKRRDDLVRYARNLATDHTADDKDQLRPAIRALKSMQHELSGDGVLHAGIFGSIARGDGSPDSDIDVLIDIDVHSVGDALRFIAICEAIKARLGEYCPGRAIDVVDHWTLKGRVREAAERDAIYAF